MTVTAIPETGEQLEEALHDDALMNNIYAEGNFGKFMAAYMRSFVSKNEEDVRQFREKSQADLADFMRIQADRNGARPPEGWKPGMGMAPAKGRSARRARAIARSKLANAAEVFDAQGLFCPTAAGAGEDIEGAGYADSLTRFVWAALKGEHMAAQNGDAAGIDALRAFKGQLAKTLEIRNANMAERVGSEGGFLVPETLRSEILALTLEDGVMREGATVIPMDSLRVPIPAVDDTSHSTSVFGGVQAFWTAEGASLKATAPSFGRVDLEAAKLTAFTQIPNELLQDSVTPMDVWFHTFFPQAMAFFEDLAFLTGNGVNQPEGLLNCPGATVVDPGTTATIALADVIAMLCRLWPPSLKRARWVTSPDGLKQLLGLGLVVGSTAIAPPALLTGYQAIEAPAGSDGSGFNFRMFGRPLRVSEKVPYPGGGVNGTLALYDPTAYLIGDRQAMQVASSAEYSFASDEVSYRVIERLDGRGWQRTPLTPANGSSSTLSMIVTLADTHT